MDHHDFEIENQNEQNIRTGALYSYSAEPYYVSPFKANNYINKNKYLKLVEKIYPICQKYKINLILHQNYDLNLDDKYKIDGIHLSYNIFKSLNENIKAELIKKYKRIGVSVHSLDEAKEVENLGANYVVAGHIFETDCKKGLEPRGLKFVEDLSSTLTIPIFAIGGIDEKKSLSVIDSGAFSVCMMSSMMKY